MKNLLYISLIGLITLACSPGSIPSSSSEGHKENLDHLRPEINILEDTTTTLQVTNTTDSDYSTITPSYDVTDELYLVLDSIASLRSDIKYVSGYTILVYSGTNSEQAHISKGKVFSILPDSSPELKFDEPNFRVKVGNYYSRLEAQKDFARLKAKFPRAIIIPERIYIN